MKLHKIVITSLAAVLIAGTATFMCGCTSADTSVGGSYLPSPAAVRSGVALVTYKTLSEAKTVEKYNRQIVLASQVSQALTLFTTEGLTVQTIVIALGAQFGNDPEIMLYAEVALAFLPSSFPTITLRNEYLSAAADGIIRGIGMTREPQQ